MSKDIVQLGLFDSKYPECLTVAHKWNFPLIPVNPDDKQVKYIYRVLEWVAGLNGYTTHDRNARNAVARLKHSGIFSKNQYFINFASEDPNEILSDAQGLYLIAQNMRVRKDTPQIAEIKDYLAKSGVFVDVARSNPQAMGEALLNVAAYQREQEIAKYERAGLADKSEVQWLKARHEGIETLNTLRTTIADLVENPKYSDFFDAEALAMFGQKISQLKVTLSSDSVRDALPTLQLSYLRIAELELHELLKQAGIMTMPQLLDNTRLIVKPLGEHLKAVCDMLGVNHITGQPLIPAWSVSKNFD